MTARRAHLGSLQQQKKTGYVIIVGLWAPRRQTLPPRGAAISPFISRRRGLAWSRPHRIGADPPPKERCAARSAKSGRARDAAARSGLISADNPVTAQTSVTGLRQGFPSAPSSAPGMSARRDLMVAPQQFLELFARRDGSGPSHRDKIPAQVSVSSRRPPGV